MLLSNGPMGRGARTLSRGAADLHTSLGIGLAALHDPSAAEEHFTKAPRVHPDLASANYNLGLALRQQGKTNEAQVYFDKGEQLKRKGVQPRL